MNNMTDNSSNMGLLKRFTLNRLNGYKTITLHSATRVKIVAGENGAGKTSLLNSLYAVLAGKPAILFKIDFESLEIEWSNGGFSSAKRSELFPTLQEQKLKRSPAFQFLVESGISIDEAFELLQFYIVKDDAAILASSGYKTLYAETPYDKDDIYGFCKQAVDGMILQGTFEELHLQVKQRLGEVSVLYLPTYRRIEADLVEFRTTPAVTQRRLRSGKDSWDSDRLINFGLEDVENKLRAISTAIRRETLDAYSRNSGETLEELINISSIEDDLSESIDLASINLILSRIGKQSTDIESKLKQLIDSNTIYGKDYVLLRRFLSQLLQVYAGRQQDENAIEAFASLINSYLSLSGEAEKVFYFDKQRVELQIVNKFTSMSLPLGALSSGEKQIVSVFARLLLDPNKRYFIIIDEPELSLSIEWQERFLVDIAGSQSCEQLIAITHSPFIFQNELARVAGSLEVKLHHSGVDEAGD